MLQVPPGELLALRSGLVFDISHHPRWRVHLLDDVFMLLNEGVR